jgi:CubicO group peptidase (beta-lactamase class C family)
MVEYLSGEAIGAYCRNHIFLPLGMSETSYHTADLHPENLASWYWVDGRPIAPYTRRDYPVGQTKSLVLDLSRFLTAWINDGTYLENRILQKETVDDALWLHNPASGRCLIWSTIGNWYGHSGGVNGASTYMEFHRQDKVGLIILSNMYHKDNNPMYPPAGGIYELIRKFANQYRNE